MSDPHGPAWPSITATMDADGSYDLVVDERATVLAEEPQDEAHARRLVIAHVREMAEGLGRPLQIEATDSGGKSRVLVMPDGQVEAVDAAHDAEQATQEDPSSRPDERPQPTPVTPGPSGGRGWWPFSRRRRQAEEEAERAAQAAAEEDARRAAEQQRAEEERRAQAARAERHRRRKVMDVPVARHRVTVSQLKGGTTKTTTTLGLGTALSLYRREPVIGLDANPHRGNLARRLGEEPHQLTVRDLVNAEVDSAAELRPYTHQSWTRFEVIASERDPVVSAAFSVEEYEKALAIVERFRSVIITDTGIDLTTPVMESIAEHTDTLVVPATTAEDSAELAWEALDWWYSRRPDLVERAIVSITDVEPFSAPHGATPDQIDAAHRDWAMQQRHRAAQLAEHFTSRVRQLIFVPFDPWLRAGGHFQWQQLRPETAAAYESLAYRVAEQFQAPEWYSNRGRG